MSDDDDSLEDGEAQNVHDPVVDISQHPIMTGEEYDSRRESLISEFNVKSQNFRAQRDAFIDTEVEPSRRAGLRHQLNSFRSVVGADLIPEGETLSAIVVNNIRDSIRKSNVHLQQELDAFRSSYAATPSAEEREQLSQDLVQKIIESSQRAQNFGVPGAFPCPALEQRESLQGVHYGPRIERR